MRSMVRHRRSAIVAASATLLSAGTLPCAAQARPLSGTRERSGTVALPPNVAGDPQPREGQTAILNLLDKYEVVGMGAGHGNKDLDDFILALIRNPALPGRVNDIAVECGN